MTFLMLEHGLPDRLDLWVHPFLLRSGEPEGQLLRPGTVARFDPADVRTLPSGIAILSYEKS